MLRVYDEKTNRGQPTMSIQQFGTCSDRYGWTRDLADTLAWMGLDPTEKHSIEVIHAAGLLLCRRYLQGKV